MKQGNGREALCIWHEMAGERLRTESAGEYSLPDYRPEVRRILSVDTRILPSGSYCAGGSAEYAGLCVHTVLYSAGDGSLASLEFSTEYGYTLPVEEGATVIAPTPTVEGVSCRLLGPRRLSVRATLGVTPHVLAARSPEPLPEAGEDLVCLTHPLSLFESRLLTAGDLGYQETVLRDGALEPLLIRACPTVSETAVSGDTVSVKGEVALAILCASSGHLPETVSHAVPFSVALPLDGIDCGKDPAVLARAALRTLDLAAAPSDTGGTAFTVDFTLEVEAEILCKREYATVVDLFSLKTPVKCRKEELPVTEMLALETHEETVTVQISRSESDSEEASAVLLAGATVRLREEEHRDGMLCLAGECRAELALALGASDPEGRLGYSASAFTAPISLAFPLPESLPEDAACEAEVRVLSVSGRLDPQNLAADCRLSVTLRYLRHRTVTVALAPEEVGEPYPPMPSCEIVAVYPEDGDSLWSLARRYRVSPSQLALENGLSESATADADLPSSLDGRACITVSYLP